MNVVKGYNGNLLQVHPTGIGWTHRVRANYYDGPLVVEHHQIRDGHYLPVNWILP